MHEIQSSPLRYALIVGIETHGTDSRDSAASLAELERLVNTLGFAIAASVVQRRSKLLPATLIGSGKVAELARYTGGSGIVRSVVPKSSGKKKSHELQDREEDSSGDPNGADPEIWDRDPRLTLGSALPKASLVVFDHELSPRQARNLEEAFGCEVLDRAGVILEIFHRHARSREARAQVEIARLRYVAPRLRETGPSDRQQGGVGQKGLGETAYELERRRVRDRISELESELETIHREQKQRRERRAAEQRVALVGYTNAGKSSLMRALTGSQVVVADKLFATLDTTVRAVQPETHPRILVSDTVGFISRLPHDLVASFRSTLDEALDAALILHVIDASDPELRKQIAVTEEVLKEIGAHQIPRILVLNKADLLNKGLRNRLPMIFPGSILVSAIEPESVANFRAQLIDFFESRMREATLLIPYSLSGLAAEIREQARILAEDFQEDGILLKILAYPEFIARVKKRLEKSEAKPQVPGESA